MVTHIKYPACDKENPASISSIIIQELLREELGYNGILQAVKDGREGIREAN